jgi:hypothetical protein
MIHEIVKPDILKPYVEPKSDVDEISLNYNIDFLNDVIKKNIETLSQGEYVVCKISYLNNNEINHAMDLFRKAGWVMGYTADTVPRNLHISIKRDLTKKQ